MSDVEISLVRIRYALESLLDKDRKELTILIQSGAAIGAVNTVSETPILLDQLRSKLAPFDRNARAQFVHSIEMWTVAREDGDQTEDINIQLEA